MTLGAFISSGTAGLAAAKFGRKHCLWAACVLCCISNVIMMATESVEALYAGRFLIGLANGYFMTFSQLYIQESSPETVFAAEFCSGEAGCAGADEGAEGHEGGDELLSEGVEVPTEGGVGSSMPKDLKNIDVRLFIATHCM